MPAESSNQSVHGQGQTATPPAPITDSLQLPLPPVSLLIASGDRERKVQRYFRKGNSCDATDAVVGKGGFGTAYRFERDDSFVYQNDLPDNRPSDDGTRQDQSCDFESVEAFLSNSSINNRDPSLVKDVSRGREEHCRKVDAHSAGWSATQTNYIPKKAPAVIVVKVCRTPTSGSYDELPKTGRGREEAKLAAYELAQGTPTGEHTRIVRGEARLLRYLQMAHSMMKGEKTCFLVNLLADIRMPSSSIDDFGEEEEQYGPPVPRLLLFERLVDLDAELSPRGWVKDKRFWTVEKVEAVSRDVMAGLRFLHDHHVVHGDLKPSNFMRDAKTGCVKLIDLGASRRWVRLHNIAKERTTAVEELDEAVRKGIAPIPALGGLLCEGLGSLTGSPHFMAPEVLLQASRYSTAEGLQKSVLDDHILTRTHLPNVPSASLLEPAYRDFRRGWGIKADIWSWGCSVMSLLLRTLPAAERPSSNSICAFDFSFERKGDVLLPAWPLHPSSETQPRFHQWARSYPLRIMQVLHDGVELPEIASAFSPPMLRVLHVTFQQQDRRPPASAIIEFLEANAAPRLNSTARTTVGMSSSRTVHVQEIRRKSSRPLSRASYSVPSDPEDPHNISLSTSAATSASPSVTGQDGAIQLGATHQSYIMTDPVSKPKYIPTSARSITANQQQSFQQNQLIQSPLISPSLGVVLPPPLLPSPIPRALQHDQRTGTWVLPGIKSLALPSSSRQPLASSPMARESNPIMQQRLYSQKSLSLADEVFMDAYEKEQRELPFSPLTPNMQMRGLETTIHPVSSSDQNSKCQQLQVPRNGMDGSSSMVWCNRDAEQHSLRSKLSFPSIHLPKRRTSFLSRVASHLTPRQASNHSAGQSQSKNNDWPSDGEMLVDDLTEHLHKDEQQQQQQQQQLQQHGTMNKGTEGYCNALSFTQSTNNLINIHGNTYHQGSTRDHPIESVISSLEFSSPTFSRSPATATTSSNQLKGSSTSSPITNQSSLHGPLIAPLREFLSPREPSCPPTFVQEKMGSLRSRKTSNGVLGLGLNLNLPNLRTVRSFSSPTTRGTKTATGGGVGGSSWFTHSGHAIVPPDLSRTRTNHSSNTAAAAAAATSCSDEQIITSNPPLQPNDFLQHDPYAIDASACRDETSNQFDNLLNNPNVPKRGRSWSFIFKRKKV